MNIRYLLEALIDLESAHDFTIDPHERAEIRSAHEATAKILRKRGCIVSPIPEDKPNELPKTDRPDQ